jgi:hypothetical protein
MLTSAQNNIAIIEITKELEDVFYRHIRNIAKHLRQADYDELDAAVKHSPYEEVFLSCEQSLKKWIVIKVEGSLFIPVALFGVVKNDGFGTPWMVATNSFNSVKGFISRNVKGYLDIMKRLCGQLINGVDARNVTSINWLKRCGFIIEGSPIMVNGFPFYRFHMEANNV